MQLKTWLESCHGIAAAGDHGFADDGEARALARPAGGLRRAAVLVLYINRPSGPTILFTQRTAHLSDHAGQISFPGGRMESGDRDAADTALRETREETGIDAARIEVAGHLPQYVTGTGYLITPVVAWLDPPVEFQPDPTEVEECFEVPATFVTHPRNQRVEQAMYKGRLRNYFAIPFERRYIWGATAGMLVSLSRVLAVAQGLPAPSPVLAPTDSAD